MIELTSFVSVFDYAEHPVLGKKTIKSLKKHYVRYANRHNWIVSIKGIEDKVFPKVYKDLGVVTSEEKRIVEGYFDTFVAILTSFGGKEAFLYFEKYHSRLWN